MADKAFPILLDLRGGRNGGDPVQSPTLRELNQCAEAKNVDWFRGMIGRRRGGSGALSLTGGTAPTYPINAMARFVPGKDETAAELWLIDNAATPVFKRLAGGTTWADVTVVDACTSRPQDAQFATFNGKLFIAYPSAVDRLHVYNPRETVPKVRRVGIDPGTTAPTVANQGSGSYAAAARYYRQRFLLIDAAGVTSVKSEPTDSRSFTPDGSSLSARVTKAATPAGETVTHWMVEASTDDSTFYDLSGAIAIGTTFYDDTALISAYSTGELSEVLGTYTLPTSAKFLVTDGERLLMSGANSATGQNSRIWWTPVLGSGIADDERIPVLETGIRFYTDVGENDGGAVTAMGGPLSASRIYAFKYRAIWRLVPTGDPVVPYLQRKLTGGPVGVGCVDDSSVVLGTDNVGEPFLGFLSDHGPYRLGTGGLEFIGFDVSDVWDTANLDATTQFAHGIYYPRLGQIWWWIAVGSENEPTTERLVFDIRQGRVTTSGEVRRGWARHDGVAAAARCSTMFSDAVGASMGRRLKPYIARNSGGAAKILKCDTTDQDDDGTTFQAYLTTPPLSLVGQNGVQQTPTRPVLVADAQPGVFIQLTLTKNFEAEPPRYATVSLTPETIESKVIRVFEDAEIDEARSLSFTLGDAQAIAASWTLQELMIPVQVAGVVP